MKAKKKMKEDIERFKKENGNNEFTQKEMIMYLIQKIEKVDNKLNDGSGKIAENRTKLDSLTRFLKFGAGIMVGIIGYLFVQIVMIWQSIGT